MGGGGGDQVQRTEPWSGQAPYLRDIFGQAQQLYGQNLGQPYPGEMVAPFSPQTQLGMDMLTQRALGGDPMQNMFGNMLAGQMGQQNVDPSMIAQGGFGAMGGIQPGMDLMQQAGQAGPGFGEAANMFGVGSDIGLPGASQFAGGVTSPYTQALMGQSGYGGLGEASQFFGQATGGGALPAAQQFAGDILGQGGPDLDAAMAAGQGALPQQALGQLGQTAGGGFLGSNPYLDQVYDQAAQGVTERFQEDVLPGLAAQFGAAGRTGSGAQALATGRAAGDVAQELRGLAGDIYAPAYEAERGRQVQAAGQLGQLGLGGGQLGADIFGQQGQLGLGAGGLAQGLGGLGLQGQQAAADMYLGERGLGQQAMTEAGRLGLGGGQLAAQLYGTGQQGELARLGMAGDMYGQGLDRMLAAGQGLGTLGLGGMEGLTGLYGDIARNQLQAGTLAPAFREMQYGDIDQLMRVGGMAEDQAQRIIDAQMQRYQQQQQQPWQNLGQYSNIINMLPGGYGSTTQSGPSGSRLQGALGGAATGFGIGGPWGAAIGGLGGLLFGG